jgi:BatD DUF11 like domain
MRAALARAMAILTLLAPSGAWAQQSPAPEPILRASLDPPRVVVGQRTTLRIDVLAPNYMTAPPDVPGFELRNAVTRQLQSVNISDDRNGTSYAGVRFEYAIYPQEPGSYEIADQKVSLKYAAEPPATRQAVLPLPRVTFEAFVPDAAASLSPFLSANSLSVEQAIKRSSDQLKAGDSVTRIITIKADGTPAMLLPPQRFAAIAGLALYPAQPSLEDKVDGRSDAMTSTRTDAATYMLEQPGDYALPAIDIAWWNVGANRIETAHLDAVAIQVTGTPAAAAAQSGGAIARRSWHAVTDFLAEHWLVALLVLAALAALCWNLPRAVRAIAGEHRRRHEAYLRSEQFWFDRLCLVARRGDARASYFTLIEWLQRFGPAGTLDTFKAAARDPLLDRELDSLEAQLFAGRAAGDWSPRHFIRHVTSGRRRLQRQSHRSAAAHALPSRLNPAGDPVVSGMQWRRPAK